MRKSIREFISGIMVISFIIIAVILLLRYAMVESEKEEKIKSARIEQIASIQHPLRRIVSSTKETSNSSGGFFMFFGKYNSNNEKINMVRIAWLGSDGVYTISEVPLTKVRVKLVDTKIPYITINVGKYYMNNESKYLESDYNYDYITIHCRDDQFKEKLDIDGVL